MKNLAITIFVVLLIAVLGLYLVSFQVRETESAIVMTFGKAGRPIITPGLYYKWPDPIQKKIKFDSRMKVLDVEIAETTTRGAVPIIVNTYVVWKIADPLIFFNAVGTEKEAQNKLRNQISNTQNKIIGRHDFSEFVNSDPAKIKFDEIQDEMLTDLKQVVMNNYGIEIRTLGIKQLKVSKDVSKDVFDRMKAERNRKTLATIAEGNAQAMKIRTDADSKRMELLAAAEARAKAIQGQGDAEAAKYYQLLEKDPELAMFLRDIDALKKILQKNSTIILGADTEPFKLLKQMPEIKSAK